MGKLNKQARIQAAVMIALALFSFFVLSNIATSPIVLSSTIGALNEKQNTVAAISGVSIAAASLLGIIPGGQAISNELVELGGFFIVILAAIFLEKILISIGGLAAFKILIPIGLASGALYCLSKKESFKRLAQKFISFGLVLFLLVPASVLISGTVEKNRDLYASQAEIQELQSEIDNLEGNSGEDTTADENSSWLDKAKDMISGTVTSLKTVPARVKAFPSLAKDKYNAFVNFVAFFIVTTCVIPIVVLIILIEATKHLFGITGKINYMAIAKTPGIFISNKKKSFESNDGTVE